MRGLPQSVGFAVLTAGERCTTCGGSLKKLAHADVEG